MHHHDIRGRTSAARVIPYTTNHGGIETQNSSCTTHAIRAGKVKAGVQLEESAPVLTDFFSIIRNYKNHSRSGARVGGPNVSEIQYFHQLLRVRLGGDCIAQVSGVPRLFSVCAKSLVKCLFCAVSSLPELHIVTISPHKGLISFQRTHFIRMRDLCVSFVSARRNKRHLGLDVCAEKTRWRLS